jgi:predicted MFS family arabinose efflux permease
MPAGQLNPLTGIRKYVVQIRDFQQSLRLLLLAVLLNAIGTGFILPFIAIYFHEVVGLSYSVIGMALALRAGVDLFAKLAAGQLVDSIGRKRTLILGIVFLIGGYVSYLQASSLNGLLIAVSVEGIGIGLFWPSTLSIISDLVPEKIREEGFAFDHVTRTAGLGIGIMLAGFISTYSYRVLFYLDILFTTFFLIMIILKIPETMPKEEKSVANTDNLLTALRDPRLIGFMLITIVFTTLAALFFEILAPFLKEVLSVTNLLIGNLFLIYAAILVFYQLQVTEYVKGLERFSPFRAGFGLWAVAGLLLFVAEPGAFALVLSSTALVLITGAAMIYGPSAASFVSRIAPDGFTGAYMSIYSISWSFGFIAGPLIGGWFLDSAAPSYLWLLVAAVSMLSLFAINLYEKTLMD